MTPRHPRRSVLAVAALALPLLVAACGGGGDLHHDHRAGAAGADRGASADAYPAGCPTTQPPALKAGETRTVTITTEQGDFVIKVTADLSPIATGNFVALAECGWYDNVVFHRLVPGFVIQGGDGQYGRAPNVDAQLVGTGGPPYSIQDEPVTTAYHRGTVAMARTLAAQQRGLAVLRRPRRRRGGSARRPAVQQLPDHRRGHARAWRRSTRSPRCPTRAAGQPGARSPSPMTDVAVANP